MKKVSVVALTLCLVMVFTASVWAADFPGQKLTQDELSSITGKADPTITIGTLTVGTLTSSLTGTSSATGYIIPSQTLGQPGVFSFTISGSITK